MLVEPEAMVNRCGHGDSHGDSHGDGDGDAHGDRYISQGGPIISPRGCRYISHYIP